MIDDADYWDCSTQSVTSSTYNDEWACSTLCDEWGDAQLRDTAGQAVLLL